MAKTKEQEIQQIITQIMVSTADMMQAVLESNMDDLKTWAKAAETDIRNLLDKLN